MLNRLIHVVMIVAFVFASASPACAFISGKDVSVIEICTAQGISYVTVGQDGEPLKGDEAPAHVKSFDCGFCFAQAHSVGILPDLHFIAFDVAKVDYSRSDNLLCVFDPTIVYSARGPPSSVVS